MAGLKEQLCVLGALTLRQHLDLIYNQKDLETSLSNLTLCLKGKLSKLLHLLNHSKLLKEKASSILASCMNLRSSH